MLKPLERMTLEEKIGQMFMPTYDYYHMNGDLMTLITQYHIGGVYLALKNYDKHKKHIKAMNHKLQYFATNEKPLLIANGFTSETLATIENVTAMPTEEEIYNMNHRLYTKQLAEVIGQKLQDIGMNTYLYPDLHMEYTENIRNEVNIVANHGKAILQGLRQSNVISFIKGFPNIDDIDPFIEPNRRKSNVYPFYDVIKNGADVLMISEPSETLIEDVIRTGLQFSNVVAFSLEDTLETVEEASRRIVDAIHHGVNLIILPYSYQKQIAILNKILELAHEGHINHEAIHRSVTRLCSLKEKYRLHVLNNIDRPLTTHQSNCVIEKIIRKHSTPANIT